MSQRILVIGCTGLLGSNFVRHARATCSVMGTALYSISPEIPTLQLDVTDATSVRRIVLSEPPDVIVHCAAQTRVDYCEENPQAAYRLNTDGALNVAKAASEVGALMVYISTDSVFDGQRGRYTEDDEPSPINVYGKSKLLGETAVRENSAEHIIVRTNFYGWNFKAKESLGEWVLNRLRRGERINGFTDIVFSPLLVNDLSEMILSMITGGLRGTYHVGARDEVNKCGFAKRIAQTFELDPELVRPVLFSTSGLKAPRPKVTTLNNSRIEGDLGRIMPTIQDGIRKFRYLDQIGYVAAS